MTDTIQFKRETTRPLQLATLVLTLSMAWLFLSAYHLLAAQTELANLDNFRYQLISLQRTLVDAETGQRGYLITNNVTFLEPYKDGPKKAAAQLAQLNKLTKHFPELQPKIELLREYSAAKFRIIDASIQVQLNAGAYASHLTVSKDKGKQVMESIELIISEMDALLAREKEDISAQARQILSQVILGSIVLILVIGGILLFSYRRTVMLFEQAMENKSQSERLSFEADHDQLTKLPNRRGLDTHLKRVHNLSRRMNDLYAIFYLDLDGFKAVNDQLGHEAGDAVLLQTAQLFSKVMRGTDYLGRLGGDEFVVVIHRFKDVLELETLAQRLLDSLKQPLMVNGTACQLGVSIGIARYPDNGKRLDAIQTAADKAMYASKELGKNRYSFAPVDEHTSHEQLHAIRH